MQSWWLCSPTNSTSSKATHMQGNPQSFRKVPQQYLHTLVLTARDSSKTCVRCRKKGIKCIKWGKGGVCTECKKRKKKCVYGPAGVKKPASVKKPAGAEMPAGSYKCEPCNRPFSSSYHLTRYNKTLYSDERFPCHLCTKEFNRRDNLTTYLGRHKNQAQFPRDT